MRIRIAVKAVTVAGLALALSQGGFAQQEELKIEGTSSVEGAFPGQMVEVFVGGISSQVGPPIPLDRFQILVTQDGVIREAQVRSAALGGHCHA